MELGGWRRGFRAMEADIKKQKQDAWIRGALYLSLAAFLAKGLSALYKIPYQNLTGDTGFYVYQQVYPLYGIAFVLGTYGFPIVIAKIVAEQRDSSKENGTKLLQERLLVIFGTLMVLHGSIGLFVIIFAEVIASIMGDAKLINAIRMMGLPFFLIPFLAIGRGVYQGLGNNVPTAISQVVEQLVRVIVILGIAWWAMAQGDPYLAGTSAGIGAFVGGIAAILIFIFVLRKNNHIFLQSKKYRISESLPWKTDLKDILINGFFVSVSALALVIFQFIDSMTMFRLLVSEGVSPVEAAVAKGIYDRGWPLIQFGAVVTTVFSYGVVPVLAMAFKRRERALLLTNVGYAVKVSLIFGGAAAVGLATIMPYLNGMMFMDRLGTGALQISAFVVLFGALFMTIAALLHAVNNASLAAGVLMIGLTVKLVLNVALIPTYGITGGAGSSLIAFMLMGLASLVIIKQLMLWTPLTFIFWLKWLLSLMSMFAVVWGYQWVLGQFLATGRAFDTIIALTGAVLGGFIYLIIIWKVKLFEKKEWESVPKLGAILPYKD